MTGFYALYKSTYTLLTLLYFRKRRVRGNETAMKAINFVAYCQNGFEFLMLLQTNFYCMKCKLLELLLQAGCMTGAVWVENIYMVVWIVITSNVTISIVLWNVDRGQHSDGVLLLIAM